jgi:hypothetical protein
MGSEKKLDVALALDVEAMEGLKPSLLMLILSTT